MPTLSSLTHTPWLLIWYFQVGKTNVEGLLQRHVEMAAEITNLDSDLQMLVYENYSKFISATDTIRRSGFFLLTYSAFIYAFAAILIAKWTMNSCVTL